MFFTVFSNLSVIAVIHGMTDRSRLVFLDGNGNDQFVLCMVAIRALGLYFRDPGSSPDEIHVFLIIKSCFQLEEALSCGSSMSLNLGCHCKIFS